MTIKRCLLQIRTHCLAVAMIPLTAAHVMAQDPSDAPDDAGHVEAVRRVNDVILANEAYTSAVQAGKDGDYARAYGELSYALDTLPSAQDTERHRRIFSEAYAKYATLHARIVAAEGRADEAREIVESVLAVDPRDRAAKNLLARLQAGEFANLPQHAENARRVTQLLKEARSSYSLAKYDEARDKYLDVLRIDAHNSSARRGLEMVARAKAESYEAARRHTREVAIRQVEATWELPVPLADVPSGIGAGGLLEDGGLGEITAKLDLIRFPVAMADYSLREAIDYIRQRSVEFDREADPAKKGINILIDERGINLSSPEVLDQKFINLGLPEVPLAEALRFVTGLAGVKFRTEPYAVVVVPLTSRDAALFTRRYQVPPSFLDIGGGGDGAASDVVNDPFADPGEAVGPSLRPRRSAREILQSQGVAFEEGATAFYVPATSELVVRNTQAQLDIVDQIVRGILEDQPKQIKVETKFVEIEENTAQELGFDWVMGGFWLGSDEQIMGGGGSAGGSRRAFDGSQFPFFGRQPDVPQGNPLSPVTAALRSGSEAVTQSAIEALVAAGRVGAAADIASPAPGAFSLAGVLTEPQFQVILRAIDQRGGTDLLSAPNILTRSGEEAKVEVIRELIYPTEYDPPEVPQQFGFGFAGFIGGGDDPAAVAPPTFPVTPATPTAFTTRSIGVTLEVKPQVGPDGYTIEMDLKPEVVEFEGFVNYGNPITTSGQDILGNQIRIVLTANKIEQPVFSTRRVTTNVSVYDNETVSIGGLIREDVQHVQDKLPILGDLPLLGPLFHIEAEQRKKHNLIIFVTARLINPAGQPLNREEELSEEDEVIGSSLFPPVDPFAPMSSENPIHLSE